MIKKNNGEIWKQLQFKGWKQLRKKYAISSHGRAASYYKDILTDGKLLEGSLTSGYKTLNLHIFNQFTCRIRNGNGRESVHRLHPDVINVKGLTLRLPGVHRTGGSPSTVRGLHPVIIPYFPHQLGTNRPPVVDWFTIHYSLR